MITKMLFISLLFSAKIFLAAEMEEEMNLPVMAAIHENKSLAEIRSLIKSKASVHEKCEQGFSALMLAAKNSRSKVVRLLLENDADANATNQNGHSALCFATDPEVQAALEERCKILEEIDPIEEALILLFNLLMDYSH